ncbi:MAG: BRCT domain type II-containing protein [Bacteroidia bacterium]|jgi:BRCT domain type II-containing protein
MKTRVGVNVSSISSKTDFSVVADSRGTANKQKGEKLGVRLIKEDEVT